MKLVAVDAVNVFEDRVIQSVDKAIVQLPVNNFRRLQQL